MRDERVILQEKERKGNKVHQEMEISALNRFRDEILPLLEPYGVQRLALFGSVARGEETPESDIDILVEFEEPRRLALGLFEWVRLEDELARRLGKKVDLVSAKALKPRIRPHVKADMVVLYEKTGRHGKTPGHVRRRAAHRKLRARSE